MEKVISQILEKIKESKNIIIAAHINPDADAIGSSLAFAIKVKEMGKNPVVLLEKYDERFNILPGQEFVVSENYENIKGDLFVSLDCGARSRLGDAEKFIDEMFSICIDHHMGNSNFCDLNYILPDYSSASEMVYNIFKNEGLSRDMATNLYAGIIGDTGGLRHPCTTADTMDAVTALFKYDIPFSKIYNSIMAERSLPAYRLLGLAISKTKFAENRKVAYTFISKKETEKYQGTYKDLDAIVSELINIRGVKIAFFIYEKKEASYKVSLRAKDEFDVSKIAALFGGGGHIKAAGCTIENMEIDEIIKNILFETHKLF